MSAFTKDILRTITKGRKRFLSIVIITTLGVMMFSGLQASCMDLRRSADTFFDEQHLHDLSIVSTLGLTKEDVDALKALEETAIAEGTFTKTVQAHFADNDIDIALESYGDNALDLVFLKEGRVPEREDEVVVTDTFLRDSGAAIGDSFTIEEEVEEDEEPVFLLTAFTITGLVVDPRDVNNPNGSTAFRGGMNVTPLAFVQPSVVESDYYTGVRLQMKDTAGLFCFGEAYETRVRALREKIEEGIKADREQARYEEIRKEAQDAIDEARQEADEELADAWQEITDAKAEFEETIADAEKEIADAEKEVRDGEKELSDAEKEVADGEQELAEKEQEAREEIEKAKKELADGRDDLNAAWSTLVQSEQELDTGAAQLEEGKETLRKAQESAYAQIESSRAEAEAGLKQAQAGKETAENALSQAEGAIAQLEGAISDLESGIAALPDDAAERAAMEAQLTELHGQLSGAQAGREQAAAGVAQAEEGIAQATAGLAQIEAAKQEADARFSDGWAEIDAKQAQIDHARRQIEEGWEDYRSGLKELEDGEKELAEKETEADKEIADAKQELEDARQEIADNQKKLRDARKEIADAKTDLEEGRVEGEEKIADAQKEYEEGKQEAEEEIGKALQELEDLDMATWYVFDRNTLSGYNNVKSDADSIDAIGAVFPVVFFVVAILISLTSVTRMVEEDRGLIGTYKALGYDERQIERKYLVFTSAAGILGSVFGTLLGFLALPAFIFTIFQIMYILPYYHASFLMTNGIAGPLLFLGGVVFAAHFACRSACRDVPAALMRPKTPRAGSRVLLERFTALWHRLSFLNKVTARNIFRYKKRMLMTVFGIAGCMALLLFGFAIRDSVGDLMPRQYEQTSRYDLMVVASTNEEEEETQKLSYYLTHDEEIAFYLPAFISTVKLQNETGQELTSQMVVVPDGEALRSYVAAIPKGGGEELVLHDGDVFVTRNAGTILSFSDGDRLRIRLADLQTADMQVSALTENYLGNTVYMTRATYESMYTDYEENGALILLKDDVADEAAYREMFADREGILTCVSTEQMKEQFSQAFLLMNSIVLIVIGMSAALAFAVLFTLATTNISERERELATIKVLGFYDREVHLYVDKETLILVCIGILFGVPLGYLFAQTLPVILALPAMYLKASLHGISYGYAAGCTLFFTLAVNLLTDRILNRINPVEALKSVE